METLEPVGTVETFLSKLLIPQMGKSETQEGWDLTLRWAAQDKAGI